MAGYWQNAINNQLVQNGIVFKKLPKYSPSLLNSFVLIYVAISQATTKKQIPHKIDVNTLSGLHFFLLKSRIQKPKELIKSAEIKIDNTKCPSS